MTYGLSYNPRVVELDREQPGISPVPPPFAPYLASHVDAARVAGGRALYDQMAGFAYGIERQYGVPAKMLIAIWGHETNYGRYTGDFDLARSLASLAYEGRRRDLFANEFIALLKMAERGVPRERMFGSWAGAFGNPQFLPVYLSAAGGGRRWRWQPRHLEQPRRYACLDRQLFPRRRMAAGRALGRARGSARRFQTLCGYEPAAGRQLHPGPCPAFGVEAGVRMARSRRGSARAD